MKRILFALLVVLLACSPSVAVESVDVVALDGTLSHGTITVTTAATAIPTTAQVGRRSIIVINTSTGTVYLGGSSVTTANGFQLETDTAISIDISDNIVLYGIVGSGTADVRYMELR